MLLYSISIIHELRFFVKVETPSSSSLVDVNLDPLVGSISGGSRLCMFGVFGSMFEGGRDGSWIYHI
jgi:hypothetical protein